MREDMYDGTVSFNPGSELALNVALEPAPNDLVTILLLDLLEGQISTKDRPASFSHHRLCPFNKDDSSKEKVLWNPQDHIHMFFKF